MRLNLAESRLAELWEMALSNKAMDDALSTDETRIVNQYRAINGSLKKAWANAPMNAVDLAKGIMPQRSRKFSIARLVHPRPHLGFARGEVSQVQFESEEVAVRIQIEGVSGGWKLWGRTSVPGWAIWSGQSNIQCNDDGEFELDVKTGSVEPLSLQNETITILLPMNIDETDGSG